jgi:ribosome recycling factor
MQTFPLRDLATIAPRASGRQISILASEEAYVKPILAALQRSDDFSAQPQRDPDNELELVLKVEVERPEDTTRRIREVCNRWRERVRDVTARREKVVRGWVRENTITGDVGRRLDKELGKLQTKELGRVDVVEKRELQQGVQQKV